MIRINEIFIWTKQQVCPEKIIQYNLLPSVKPPNPLPHFGGEGKKDTNLAAWE
jgi:hypothetical protein